MVKNIIGNGTQFCGSLVDPMIQLLICHMVKAVWPFLLAEVIILLLMILFPATVIVPMNFFTGG